VFDRRRRGPDARRDYPGPSCEAKEGLSLLNGRRHASRCLSLATLERDISGDSADVAASLSLDALAGRPRRVRCADMHARARTTGSCDNGWRGISRHFNEGSRFDESHRSATIRHARAWDALQPPLSDRRYTERCAIRWRRQSHAGVELKQRSR